MTLHALAQKHCGASRPALCLKGFIESHYGVSSRFFFLAASGKKNPSAKLLRALSQAHVRLFPNDPVTLELPNNHPPVLLGQPSNN